MAYPEDQLQQVGAHSEVDSIFDELKPLPKYYSESAIYGFSLLLGVLFGSVMLAINCKNTPGKKGLWQVLGFGVMYTIVQVWVLDLMPQSSSGMTIVFNIAGAVMLKNVFWKNYIGKVAYTKKKLWGPVIAALLIVALLAVVLLLPLAE